VLFVITVAALLGVLILAQKAGQTEQPPEPSAFVPPEGPTYLAFDVEAVSGGKVRLASGSGSETDATEVEFPAGTRIWRMEPATAAELTPPLVVNAVSVPNEVRNYSLRMMVFAPVQDTVSFDSPYLALADGFFGAETSRDEKEKVVSSALLESFDGRDGVTKTATGPGTLFVGDGAPVWIVRPIEAAQIQPGDRIAMHKGNDDAPDPSQGVLVLEGGAR